MREFIWKRDVNYFWEKTLAKISSPLVIWLVNTPITPNMVTVFNMVINIPFILFLCVTRHFYMLAVAIQLYALLDIVDGSLARNKNMKSELGRKLDIITDYIYYIVVNIAVGYAVQIPLLQAFALVLIHMIYAGIATYYIVPHIRKMPDFKHTPLKSWFAERGILFGMDAILQCLITSVLLLTPFRKMIFVICPILWVVDLVYRLYELLIFNKVQRES
jgi:phosphatidylglycerophosphate synthase